jgi:hypothetical protein
MAKKATKADDTFEGSDTSVMVDLSDVAEASFEVLPRGVYDGVISNCDYTLSQSSGKPMWAAQITIDEGEYEGRKLFTHFSFSENALPMTKKHLAVVAPELLSGGFNPEEVASDMEGKKVRVKVAIKKYEGSDRNNVTDFLPLGDAGGFM